MLSLIMLAAAAAPAVLTGCQTVGTTYYISSSEGDDNADGLSPATAWRGFANVKPLRLTAGDRVLLKRGDEWNETLYVHAGGTEQNWVKVSYYGDENDPKPIIRLNNKSGDICIVAEDCAVKTPYVNGLNYIHIDGIDCRDARMGVYFRYYFDTPGKGLKVTDCEFTDMDVPDLFSILIDLKNDEHLLAEDMAAGKDSLSSYSSGIYRSSGGGVREFAWPAGVMVGGVYLDADGNTVNAEKASDITIENCVFRGCLTGVSSWFFGAHDLTGDVEKRLTKNWRIADCIFDSSLAGAVTLENADGGFTGDENGWGVFKNLRLVGGSDYKCIYGSTGGCFQTCKNFLIDNCEFSYVNNNGSNDGCGFDFEGSDYNIIMRNSVFHNNEAHAILMMQAVGPCKNVTLENLLFYNNILNPAQADYNADFTLFNAYGKKHESIVFRNTVHYLLPEHKLTKRPLKAVNISFEGLMTEGVSEDKTGQYRTRFGFNKEGDAEGFIAEKGSLSVSGGTLVFTPSEKGGRIMSGDIGINHKLYKKLAVSLSAEEKGRATVYITTLADYAPKKVGSFDYDAGEGVYTADISADSPVRGVSVVFESSSKPIKIDYIEAVADIAVTKNIEGDRLTISVAGDSYPLFSEKLSLNDIIIEGAEAEALVYANHNTAVIKLKEAVTDVKATLKPEAFIEYFYDVLRGVDGCGFSPAAEMEIRGYASPQEYFFYNLAAEDETVKSAGGCGNNG